MSVNTMLGRKNQSTFWATVLFAWIVLLPLAGVAVAGPLNPEGHLQEKDVVKFDPSFEKSLFGVQDPSKWKITRTLHVNPASKAADDKGPGTADKPLKTVAHAIERVKPGTRVLIYPGLYRESIMLQKTEDRDPSGTAESPVVIEAKEPGTVILSGADVWTDWTSEGNDVYSAAWPHKWGFVSNDWRVGLLGQRWEMVFCDDQLMRQVLEREEMAADTYFVDEAAERIYIWLKDSAKPQEHKLEVTVRETGLGAGEEWEVEFYPSYIAVKGIAFNRFVRNFFLGKHMLLEDCHFEWNNCGLPIGGEDYVLRRVVALHNGGRSIVIPPRGAVPGLPAEITHQHMNGLLEDVTASYGNWRLSDYGGMDAWATAGIKVHTLQNLIFRRNKIQHNHAPGIWTDTKCNNVLIEDSLITHNKCSGIWVEINNGETVLRHNIIAKNSVGINLSNTCHLTVQGNTIYGNTRDQIGNWHRGPIRSGFRTANLKVIDNRIIATDPKQKLINIPGYDYIPETATFSNNIYYQPDKAVFGFGKQMDFVQWQKAMRETGSVFADPMFRDPETLDFTPQPGSPLLASSKPTGAVALWPQGAPGALGKEGKDVPTLTPFWPAPEQASGAAMVICPGGGYRFLASHEGKDYARWLNQYGITCFVLKSRLGPDGYHYPAMFDDVSRAMRLVRSKAREWELDPNRIGIMGSSAGGHLASMLLTHFDNGNPQATDLIEQASCRPDLGILCYPVITMGPYTDLGSKNNLLGLNPDPELVLRLSSELQVSPQTPPCFVWHACDDKIVPVENSLSFVEALQKAQVPVNFHLYQTGKHGMGLGRSAFTPGHYHPWTDNCLYWLQTQGYIKSGS